MRLMATLLVDWITGFISHTGYFGVFILMTLESACIPIPSEVVMPFSASLIVTRPSLGFSLYMLTSVGALANLAGSAIAYWVGACGGRRFIHRYGKYLLIRDEDIRRSGQFFARYGQAAVLLSRMLPVIRTFISLPAGIAQMPFLRFCLFTVLGALPFCFALAYAGVKLGQHWETVHAWVVKANIGITVVLVLFITWWVARRLRPEGAKNGERS